MDEATSGLVLKADADVLERPFAVRHRGLLGHAEKRGFVFALPHAYGVV